jgi:ABC-2 type transport system permease protein
MLFKLFVTDLKMLLRNKQSLFWAFMFPILFTIIFGFFFGKNTIVGNIALVDNSNTQIAQNLDKTITDSKIFKVNKNISEGDIKNQIKKSTISAGIVIPKDFGATIAGSPNTIKIIYDPGNAQTNSVITGFLQNYLTQASFQIQHTEPLFKLEEEKTSNRTLSYFDFVLAGILGLALMNSSIIGIAISMSKYREDKILKRITTTPLPSWKFIVAEILSHLIINVLQVSVILSIGYFFFDAHIYGSIFILLPIALIGAVLFQLMGFVIAALSKTTDAAQGMSQTITIPMMFLAGVFFPIDTLPKWLYSIVQYLPLAPLLRMIRGILLDAASPFENPANIIIVGGWIIVSLIFSIFRFKLSDE